MSKIRVLKSHFSAAVPDDHQAKVIEFAEEIQGLADKYGFDAYVVTVRSPVQDGLMSSFFQPVDEKTAGLLVANSMKTYGELVKMRQPNAPGA